MSNDGERTPEEVTAAIREIAAEFEPYIVRQRRHFHKYPEPSLHEVRTTCDICGQLDAMNIPYECPLETGVVATLAAPPRTPTAPTAPRAAGSCCARISTRCP